MDEIDTVYEVSLFGQMCYWLEKDEFETVRAIVRQSTNHVNLILEFTTISGMEVIIPFSSVSDLNISTRAQRDLSREINKKYKEAELEDKEKWQG